MVQRPNEWRPSTRTRVGETQHEAEGQWSGGGGETQVNHRPAPKRVVGGRWSPWKLNSRLVRATSSSPARQSSLRVPSCTHQLDVWRCSPRRRGPLHARSHYMSSCTTALRRKLRSLPVWATRQMASGGSVDPGPRETCQTPARRKVRASFSPTHEENNHALT